jgi:FMN-dependent oxidoreductase (nitrilotriacetate monooxygenase family)
VVRGSLQKKTVDRNASCGTMHRRREFRTVEFGSTHNAIPTGTHDLAADDAALHRGKLQLKPQIHLNLILSYTPVSHLQMSWVHPQDAQASGLFSAAYWKDLAVTLERGRFDGVFFADLLSVPDAGAGSAEAVMRQGSNYPRQDPMPLIALMADATKHLGFGVTLTTAGTPPFLAVRRMTTLDNLTGGRVGWNVVTSHQKSDHQALGFTQPAHDDRYDQAEEYLEICYRLWDGFPREAVIVDKSSGTFIDTGKIRKVEYEGRYYSCHAYPVTPCSPQGRPLIFQAGQSGRGMLFATKHADAIYALQPNIEFMKKFMSQVRSAAAQNGKTIQPKVFFGVQPFLGGTEEEARRRYEELRDNVRLETALNRLSGMIGVDLSEYDLDGPLQNFETEASRGLLAATLGSMEGRSPTIREAAIHWGMAIGMMPQFIGSPEQVADRIEEFWRESGAYGMSISPTVSPLSVEEFVDQVVPILQKRGLIRTEYAGSTYRENLLQQG